jgi:putative membrane protein
MGVIRWLLILVTFFFLVVFGVENMETVTLKFSLPNVFSYTAQLPLFFIVVASVFTGAILAGFIGLADHFRLRTRLRKQGKSVERLENEVKSLRNLPLEDEDDGSVQAKGAL